MTTVGEALDDFESAWIAHQPFTPQTAYRRTLRLLRLFLKEHGPDLARPLTELDAGVPAAFVRWHRRHALTDDAEGTRKVAVHMARLGDYLAAHYGLADLAVGRDALRALVPDLDDA